MTAMIRKCAELLATADAVLIGAGAGLTAAAGISYTDKRKFAELFPAWSRKGFTMQYELMGYAGWSQAEQWGYYTVHLNYVYFQQKTNHLYQLLRRIIGKKDYFVMTSNVDELFHKNGFDRDRIFTPQGSYGKIQCTIPCSETLWDITPFFEKMQQALHLNEQYITNPDFIPACPKCGSAMFINACIDNSFVDKPYRLERARLLNWLKQLSSPRLVFLELGVGHSTPGVIRIPIQKLAESFDTASFIRINIEYVEVPKSLENRSVSVREDIRTVLEQIAELLHI